MATIELGGKTRTLKFDLAALRDLETALDGRPLASVVVDMTRVGITATTAALWAGLKHEDPTLTIKLVTRMLEQYFKDGGRFPALSKALDEAFMDTGIFKTDEDDRGNSQPEPTAH